jgi:hypothetical protein
MINIALECFFANKKTDYAKSQLSYSLKDHANHKKAPRWPKEGVFRVMGLPKSLWLAL